MRVGPSTAISDLPGPDFQTRAACASGIGDERPVTLVQGTTPGGTLVSLYFDAQTNLLLRMVRFGRTPIGRVPTQMDFGDYRDVNGVKFPFKVTFAWLDGRDAIQLSKIETNVTIPDSKFNTPETVVAK